jgi:hypothetical protein
LRIAQAKSSASVASHVRAPLFLSAQPLDAPAVHGLKLLYATKGEPLVTDERYWLYAATDR